MKEFIIKEFTKTNQLFSEILQDKNLHQSLIDAALLCIFSLKNNGKIMFCGNGGSAADSQHLAAELVSKLSYNRPALAGIALTVDTSALTAIGNDYGFVHVFSRQIEAIAKKGDVLIAFSTSGKSKNVIEAVKTAKEMQIKTIAFLGKEGNEIGEICDLQINIPSFETPKIQEGHIATGHILCALIEEEFFGKTYNPNKGN